MHRQAQLPGAQLDRAFAQLATAARGAIGLRKNAKSSAATAKGGVPANASRRDLAWCFNAR
jgi:hypothetical protein